MKTADFATLQNGVAISDSRLAELTYQCSVLVRRAVLTLSALPDPDRRFQRSPRSCMPAPVREAVESYGYISERAPRFQPTTKDVSIYLDVLAWLNWLEQVDEDGRRAAQVIVARAFEIPMYRLKDQFRKSDDTIRRWEANGIAQMTFRFWRDIDRIGGR